MEAVPGPRVTTRTAPSAKRHRIAAYCLVDDLLHATLNVKDFTDFAKYEGLTLIGTKSRDAAQADRSPRRLAVLFRTDAGAIM